MHAQPRPPLLTSAPRSVGCHRQTPQLVFSASGSNSLVVATGRGPLQRLLTQIANPLIYVLLGSAFISALLGYAVDTAVILAVVLI